MANTYTQLYIHLIFGTYRRRSYIQESFRENSEKYICGIITTAKCRPLAIYCNPDHAHILINMHPAVSLSDLVRQIKSKSSKFINEQNRLSFHFRWQRGFGAFTHTHSTVDIVIKYILNQPNHHKKRKFEEEYSVTLRKHEIPYNEKYLFD